MRLSRRQRLALESICDTFCPPANGTLGAGELGVTDAVLDAVALNPRKAERDQLRQLLSVWDSKPLTALLGHGGWERFSRLPSQERERVLLSLPGRHHPARPRRRSGQGRAGRRARRALPAVGVRPGQPARRDRRGRAAAGSRRRAADLLLARRLGRLRAERSGDRARFIADADARGYGAGRIQLLGFHLQGSARMGGSPETSACDPAGQTWDVRDLYVCDGSAFPTAVGVNPHFSIQSVAHLNARGLAERLAG